MFNKIISLMLILYSALFFQACSELNQDKAHGTIENGTLMINFGLSSKNLKTIDSGTIINPDSYTIRGTGPNANTFQQTTSNQTAEIQGLISGSWTIEVDAYENGSQVGTGSTVAEINPNMITEVTIVINPPDGNGSLNLIVRWVDSSVEMTNPTIEGELISNETGNTITILSSDFTIDILSKEATYNQSAIPSGYYTLTIKIYEGSDISSSPYYGGSAEIVRIFPDQTSTGTIDLQINQNSGLIDIGIILNNPIEFSINAPSTLDRGESMTVDVSQTANNKVTEDIIYTWYINGIKIDNTTVCCGDDFSFNIGTNLIEGMYTLDIIAITVDNLAAGSANHTFEVIAVDIPYPPSNLSVQTSSSSEITISWNDNSINESGFRIERSEDGNSFSQIGNVFYNITTFTDTGLCPGSTYYYRVLAYNSIGSSSFTNEVSTATIVSSPLPPTGLAAVSSSSTQIDLTWNDNSCNEDGFRILRSIDGNVYTLLDTVSQGTTGYSDSGLDYNTTYYYHVEAYNSFGISTPAEANATTLNDIPLAPGNLTAAAVSSSRVDLAWTDNSNNEDGFNILRSNDGIVFTLIDTVSPGITGYSDTGLNYNTTYYYQVAAFNSFGTSTVASASAKTLNEIPAAPDNLTATVVSSNQIDLTWADNSDNEDGFRIERSVDGLTYSQVGLSGVDTTSYSDSGLNPDTQYFYRVVAYNSIGDSLPAENNATTDPEPLVSGLVAHWKFENNVLDEIGNSNGVEYGNPAYVAGRDGMAISFNGIDQYVNCGNHDSIASGTISVSFWMRSYDTRYRYSISKMSSYNGWNVRPNADLTSLRVYIRENASTDYTGFNTNADISDWHHYVFVLNVNEVLLFFDGNQIGTTQIFGINIGPNTDIDLILGSVDQFTGYWQGDMDDLRIYNRILSNEEIDNLYNFQTGSNPVIPALPDNLQASAISSSRIVLSWNDNSTNEDGFRVERSLDGSSFSEIATVASNINTYTDTALNESTLYYYRILAYNGAGNSDYSGTASATTHSVNQVQIIADHTVVDRYSAIPQQYIDEVKKMLVNIVGESHGRGYLYGLTELENLDAKFASNLTWTGSPEPYTTSYLRAVRTYLNQSSIWAADGGEEDFWTSVSATDMMKNHLDYMRNTLGNPVSVFMFGWCWDMTWHNAPGGTMDPVYYVRWAGSSVGAPNGDMIWGLDSGDNSLTGNTVNMQTYLDAVEAYIISDPQTVTVFTTGPIDNNTANETGYQRYLKHEYIRNYVMSNSSRILFDYADILSYNNAGEQSIGAGWTDYNGVHHNYPVIHSDNYAEYDGGEGSCHISQEGTLRLGKALWWMLARISGWDGQ